MEYRTRPDCPEYVEAFQVTKQRRTDQSDWPDWLLRLRESGEFYSREHGPNNVRFFLEKVSVSIGDWIVKYPSGNLQVVNPHRFMHFFEKSEGRRLECVQADLAMVLGRLVRESLRAESKQ